ncbi:hypothetical protein N7510_002315 [Penicillium lagena]|uniref:uncharacterized protein n=1 Tax=Penicillium lagena TaxID=94218 RepID=UPI00254050D4|nr:uncharacterized protein N7510_002315 [Penicillium lagena]KAJ5626006.1 hypothetical protein N7510_002315 [Penicillium lagena]
MQDLQVIGPVLPRTPSNFVRIRRVKCGEKRPSCTRYTGGGRNCEYDHAPFIALQNLLTTSSPVQGAALEYCFYHAAQVLSDPRDFGFWRRSAAPIPAVWDAIVALSTMYESPNVLSRLYDASSVRSSDLSSYFFSVTVPTQRRRQDLA